jgi:hypothetical protein
MSSYSQIAELQRQVSDATEHLAEVASAKRDEFGWLFAEDGKTLLASVATWLQESHPTLRGRG